MWEGTSLLDPVFIMKKSDVLLHSNYCWALGRYYYVNDIEAAPGGQLKISCHCDVLFTYANEIKACNAIVSRQEKNYNTYQTDPEFSFKNEKKISNLLFPYGFSASNQFLLCVNGKQVDKMANTDYTMYELYEYIQNPGIPVKGG